MFSCQTKGRTLRNFLRLFLRAFLFFPVVYGFTVPHGSHSLIPNGGWTKQSNRWGVNKISPSKIKEKKSGTKVYSIKITNLTENQIPEEYFKYNLPPEPIYPYITVPNNLYTRQTNDEQPDEEDSPSGGKDKLDGEKYPKNATEVGKMTSEEFSKWNEEERKKMRALPEPTIEDYIEDTNFSKYVHPCLIKKVSPKDRQKVHHSLLSLIDPKVEYSIVDCFDENDEENDLTEYDAAYKGIAPWPSTDELRRNQNDYQFEKTDLEVEYNITYDKAGYQQFRDKLLAERLRGGEKEPSTEGEGASIGGEETKTSGEESSSGSKQPTDGEPLGDQPKPTAPPPVSVEDIRKLYFKKEIKTLREAKEEMVKWEERKTNSRSTWTLTEEELKLLPDKFRQLYQQKRREKLEQISEAKRREEARQRGELQDEFSLWDEKGLSSIEKLREEGSGESSDERSSQTDSETTADVRPYQAEPPPTSTGDILHSVRLLEDNVLYTKAKSPVENMLYEWDDSLSCKWRKRAKEVIRDVIMYDYPMKEVRRPSKLDLYDVTWYAGKVEVFVTPDETQRKNYKITLFDLKQLVKKIAERLKELEIDEEIIILPFYELVVSSLPSKNILVCRRDWCSHAGKEVTVFFKDNMFPPLEGILLGSPSVFHLIINVNYERIENLDVHTIDKVILRDSKDELRGHIVLKAAMENRLVEKSESAGGAPTAGDSPRQNLPAPEGDPEIGAPLDGDDEEEEHQEVMTRRTGFDELQKLKDIERVGATPLRTNQLLPNELLPSQVRRGEDADPVGGASGARTDLDGISRVSGINRLGDDDDVARMQKQALEEDEEETDEYEEDESYDDVADGGYIYEGDEDGGGSEGGNIYEGDEDGGGSEGGNIYGVDEDRGGSNGGDLYRGDVDDYMPEE
ncbi:hypothetical protein C922_01875 [Plasmodium inui San Antonio 1]|uniref:Uncharacterized protein n=1 Tax=Plasmodium inui San Antonio 1 TaxID=1237626 RepID=W7AF85_9APIC|nr:hypothetical protein C922_01875 [Plasmodium inui San Antonio 1]EUD67689.1 hypothetical protein C922_01875 [Plasmodium inui San Antonio 1]